MNFTKKKKENPTLSHMDVLKLDRQLSEGPRGDSTWRVGGHLGI